VRFFQSGERTSSREKRVLDNKEMTVRETEDSCRSFVDDCEASHLVSLKECLEKIVMTTMSSSNPAPETVLNAINDFVADLGTPTAFSSSKAP
jgi:hypothetical protein